MANSLADLLAIRGRDPEGPQAAPGPDAAPAPADAPKPSALGMRMRELRAKGLGQADALKQAASEGLINPALLQKMIGAPPTQRGAATQGRPVYNLPPHQVDIGPSQYQAAPMWVPLDNPEHALPGETVLGGGTFPGEKVLQPKGRQPVDPALLAALMRARGGGG